MSRRFYTLDDLYAFCVQNNFSHFSAKESGAPIIIQSFGNFDIDGSSTEGLAPVTLQACHTELNRNRSYIADEVMEKALPSFANKPILAYIHQLDDGTYDFYTHNIKVVEDENSENGMSIEYEEVPIGVVPESCNAHLEYDEEKEKKYVVVNGYVYEEYGNQAVDIIKNNGGAVKVSVEIAVNEMSFNAKEGYLNIDDMYFMGVTCLGKTPDGEIVQEGMEGSNLKLDNFSAKENGMTFDSDSNKLVELLSDINQKLDNISVINSQEKEVKCDMNYFEELLTRYKVSREDVDFEYENLSDDELEKAFAEHFEMPFSKIFTVDVSHDEIRSALYQLIAQYDESDNDYYYIRAVYDNYFYMYGWINGKIYKQSYSVDGEIVSLDGERQEMFELILTESEKLAIEEMRKNYSSLVEFKENYELEESRAKKKEIFEDKAYKAISEEEEFKKVFDNMDKYSLEEVRSKCDELYGASKRENDDQEELDETSNDSLTLFGCGKKKKGRCSRYGNLFND